LEVREGAELRPRLFETGVAVSPDGRTLVYVGVSDQEQQLYRRDLHDRAVHPIPDTEGAQGPFFSPDGRWLAFRKGSEIQKVDMRGGRALTLASLETSVITGVAWSSSDTIYYGHEVGAGISRIPGSGQSTPVQAFAADSGVLYWWPSLLPGERWMIVTMTTTTTDGIGRTVAAISLETGEVRPLVNRADWGRYLGSGWLLAQLVTGSMVLVPIDPSNPRVTGEQVPIEVEAGPTTSGAPNLAWASNGTAFYVSGGTAQHTIVKVDRAGNETPILSDIEPYRDVRLSPDGERIAYTIDDTGDLWLFHLATETPTRLTFESDNLYPVWVPHGRRIIFTSRRDGIAALWSKATDGSGQVERVLEGSEIRFPGSVTPDGDRLLYRQITAGTGFDLFSVALDNPGTPEPILVTPFDEGSPMISPDGRWLAYVSNESGRNEIYLRRFPGGDARWQVSVDGGTEPMWHPSGSELFYRQETTLMSATLQLGDGALVQSRDSLFSGPYYTNIRWPEYDVMPDGDHFVMIREIGTTQQPVVVLGWVQDLIRRATEEQASD
jgi:serine/threonine-protein kinase